MQSEQKIPLWIDEAIRKAVHPEPNERYQEISEFLYDLQHPNPLFLNKRFTPFIERNPVIFWKTVSCVLSLVIVLMLVMVSLRIVPK